MAPINIYPSLAPKAVASPALGEGPTLNMDAHILPSGLPRVLPWFTMAIFVHIGGWIGDTPMSRGLSITAVQKERSKKCTIVFSDH